LVSVPLAAHCNIVSHHEMPCH